MDLNIGYGIDLTRENFYQYAVHFPFGIVTAVDVLVRIPVSLGDDGSLYCVGEIPAQSMLRLLSAPKCEDNRCIDVICTALTDSMPPAVPYPLFMFYCAGRRLHFQDSASIELDQIKRKSNCTLLYGALSLGEIDSIDELLLPRFHNAAMVCWPQQAVTYLGMNTVRGICMQYMLDASFKAASPDLKIFYETIFEASACSSELCFKLAQLLQLPDPGNLVTQVVLSYLGPLTTYSLMEKSVVISLAQSGPIERAQVEQQQLGLCAAEIGGLLMQTWKVPESLIQDVRDVDQVMVTPCRVPVDTRSARLALCYLCNRIGTLIARGELAELRTLDVTNSESIELFFLLGYLKQLVQHPFCNFPEQ